MKYQPRISTLTKPALIAVCAIVGIGMLLAIGIASRPVIAAPDQNTVCSAQVRAALDRVSNACRDLGRNEACYGNREIIAEPRANVPLDRLTFSSAGDIADLSAFQRISTSPYDQTNDQWGIALLRAQVNLPDTLPGQNVTFLLFGDTTLSADSPAMSAVSVRIRVGAVLCDGIPESALIVQSPADTIIEITINGAEVRLGSTARITAHQGGIMTISLLEGSAEIRAFDTTQELLPGTETEMALGGDDGYTVIAPPSAPLPFSLDEVDQMPLQLIEQRDWAGIDPIPLSSFDSETTVCPTPSHYIYQYVVRPGDTLSWIAGQAGVTVEELAAANCILDARFIVLGQRLAVPVEIRQSPPSQSTYLPVPQPGDGSSTSAVCGNGLCEREQGENPGLCLIDCPPSGDGGACGNGICESQYGENPGQCRIDCPPGGGDDDDDDDDDD